MYTFLVVVHVLCSVFLIAVVLLQVGRGRGMLGFLGSSTAEALFGGRAGDVLTKTTTVMAALFMVTSLSLAYLSLRKSGSITKGIKTRSGALSEATQTESAPVTQKGSDLVEAAKDKLMKKIPKLGGEKESGALKETTKSNIKYDAKGNQVVDEYKYDPSGKVIGHKEIVKDKTDKVISEKELPVAEEKAVAETPQ
jgi:preprotein translocase subunit SecG